MHLSKFNTIAICALIFIPIDLPCFSDDDHCVSLRTHGSVVIETIAELGVSADHVCRFDDDARDTVMRSAPLTGHPGTRGVDQPLLGMIHKCLSGRYAMADHGFCHDHAVGIKTFQPVIVFYTDCFGVVVIDPDGFSPSKEGEHGERVGIGAVNGPF